MNEIIYTITCGDVGHNYTGILTTSIDETINFIDTHFNIYRIEIWTNGSQVFCSAIHGDLTNDIKEDIKIGIKDAVADLSKDIFTFDKCVKFIDNFAKDTNTALDEFLISDRLRVFEEYLVVDKGFTALEAYNYMNGFEESMNELSNNTIPLVRKLSKIFTGKEDVSNINLNRRR